jgi:penicillin-binding protein 1A
VVKSGTGRRADLGFAPQAGKTGTNQGYRDAWYIGFTAHYVTGVWYGNDDFHPMNKVTGGLLPAATWKNIMLHAEQTKTAAALPGIPLDDSYAKFAAQNQPELEIVALPKPDPQVASQDIPQAGTAGGPQAGIQPGDSSIRIIPEGPNAANQVPIVRVPSVRTAQGNIPDEVSDEIVVVKPRARRDPVAAVFQDMFGLFGSDSDEPRQKVRTKKSASELILPLPNTGKSKETALQRLRKRKNRN